MKTREEILELFSKAENGTLSEDFQEWNLCDEQGWTIAHQAAYHGHLPENFHSWDLTDKYGVTVESVYYLVNNRYPEDFNN